MGRKPGGGIGKDWESLAAGWAKYWLPSWEAGWCLERVWAVERQSSLCLDFVILYLGHLCFGTKNTHWRDDTGVVASLCG